VALYWAGLKKINVYLKKRVQYIIIYVFNFSFSYRWTEISHEGKAVDEKNMLGEF